MSSPRRGRSSYELYNLWWLTAAMLGIGVYCGLWPDALLQDEFYDRLPDRVAFGYAIGAIFGGGGLLCLAESLAEQDRFKTAFAGCRSIGGLLLITGFGYVFWILFLT